MKRRIRIILFLLAAPLLIALIFGYTINNVTLAGIIIVLGIIVDDAIVQQVVETIEEAAKTGKIGDGKIWVTTVEELVRIRTGESGKEAI